MKKLLLSLTLATFLCANETVEVNSNTAGKFPTSSLEYIKTLEKGKKRDFFINEYLKEDISQNQTYEVLPLISDMNNELFYNFAKKFGHDETLAVAQCMNMESKELVDSYADCIVSGLTLKKASSLSSLDLSLIIQKTQEKYPSFTKEIKVISSSIPFTKLVIQKEQSFYDIFLGVNDSFRENYFNYKLPKRTLEKIYVDKKSFEKFLEVALSNSKLNRLNSSLKEIDDSSLSAESSFYLALNAIRFADYNSAYNYLTNSKNKSDNQKFINKIDFWIYLITKDGTILETLAKSKKFDLYSYFANELSGNSLDKNFKLESFEQFRSILKNYDFGKTAFLYAVARTESDFDIEKTSDDFKVGIMQFNPAWIIDNKKNILTDFFTFEGSLNYAKLYLDSLNIEFNNPIKEYFIYNKEEKIFKKFEENFTSDKDSLKNYLNFEYMMKDREDFLLWYLLSYNELVENKKERLTLTTIFEKL